MEETIENKIYELWNKVTPFMLLISNKIFGDEYEGGRLMMGKVLCVEGKYVEAFDYLKSCYEKQNRPTSEQFNEFYIKLKSLHYFIDRPVENFDDFLESHKILSNDGVMQDISNVVEISTFNFDYLKEFKMDFNS